MGLPRQNVRSSAHAGWPAFGRLAADPTAEGMGLLTGGIRSTGHTGPIGHRHYGIRRFPFLQVPLYTIPPLREAKAGEF